jgi:hypothetical protein
MTFAVLDFKNKVCICITWGAMVDRKIEIYASHPTRTIQMDGVWKQVLKRII